MSANQLPLHSDQAESLWPAEQGHRGLDPVLLLEQLEALAEALLDFEGAAALATRLASES